MIKKDELLKAINMLLEETTHYDFPRLIKKERKQEIILEKKSHIEERLQQLAPELWSPSFSTLDTWNAALEHTNRCFSSTPAKYRINGFYLQELMHSYVENLGQLLLIGVEEV